MTSEIVKSAEMAFGALKPIFGIIDVADKSCLTQEEVDVLASEMDVAKKTKKSIGEAIDARVNEVKAIVFRIADVEAGECEPFTMYSPNTGLKMQRQISGGGTVIDPTRLLDSLYEHFGEEKGDKEGQAWKVWSKITDPIQTRTLNTDKLTVELKKSLEAKQGIKHGTTSLYLPTEVVEESKVEVTPTESFYVRAMNKDEKKAASAGLLGD